MYGRRNIVGVVIALAITVTACQGGDADKTGGDTVTIRLATIDRVNNNGQSYGPEAFVESLTEVSGGRFRVEVLTEFGEGDATAESALIEAIASGEVDGGWPSTRAFANAGISGLEAVEAPMTITSYEAERALVTSPVADELLSRLEGSGIVGLELAVGPLRRPFAAEAPLLGPEDWAGVSFRVYNSPVQDQTVRALDGEPVNLGYAWMGEVEEGRLRGAEFDIAQYVQAGFTTEAGNVTSNVVLWPKVFVLSINEALFDSLSDEQRGWIREAAERASTASVEATYDETTLAVGLCEAGARFLEASPDQVSALRAAFQPVIDGLAATDGALLETIQGIAAEHPQTEQPTVPPTCAQGVATPQPVNGIPTELSDIPEGSYRVEITAEDVADAGLDNGDGWSGTWTLAITDGMWELFCRPLDLPGDDCGGEVQDERFEWGDVRGTGDTVYLVGDDASGFSYVLTWTVDGQRLVLTDADSPDHPYVFTIEPLTRID